MSYTNADGAFVLTGVDQGAVLPSGTKDNAASRSLIVDLDLTRVSNAVTAADIDLLAPTIPANSILTGVRMITTEAAASTGAATLSVGTYTAAGVAVSANGIVNAAALAVFDSVNKVGRTGGALVTGTTSTGAVPTYVMPIFGTVAYTAGKVKLIIEYIVTGV